METFPNIISFTWILTYTVLAEIEPHSLSYQPHTPLKRLPEFLQPCHRKHKMFNLCLKTSLQRFFESVTKGSNREIDFPPIEPLYVPEMTITEGSGNVFLDLNFHHVVIRGLSNTKVIAVRSNLEDILKVEIALKYPYLNFTGAYSCNGSVETFPLVGQGSFFFNMSDVSAAWIIYLSQADESSRYFGIQNFIMDITPVEITAKFGNAIDDDPKLGEAFNGFFNENAQEIFKMAKPKVAEALSKVFSELANKLLSYYPASVLLPY